MKLHNFLQPAHIEDMGRLLFNLSFMLVTTIVNLFLPIIASVDIHYDMNRKKFAFSLFLFKFLRVLGGYVTTYKGGIAIHVSEKKAFLKPYSDMEKDRKRFSVIKSFHLKSFCLTTETGAEYLLPIALTHAVLRTYFFAIGGKKEKIENNLWLTDGDVLRVSLNVVLSFNLYIVLRALFQSIKEKLKVLCQRKQKKSIA